LWVRNIPVEGEECKKKPFLFRIWLEQPQYSSNLSRQLSETKRKIGLPSVFFELLQYSRQHPSLILGAGCSDVKSWLDFSIIFFKICRFRSSILLFAVSFYSTRNHLSQVSHYSHILIFGSRPIIGHRLTSSLQSFPLLHFKMAETLEN